MVRGGHKGTHSKDYSRPHLKNCHAHYSLLIKLSNKAEGPKTWDLFFPQLSTSWDLKERPTIQKAIAFMITKTIKLIIKSMKSWSNAIISNDPAGKEDFIH